MMIWKKYLSGVVGLLCLLGLDQLTKRLAVLYLKDVESVPLLKGIFELQYLENRGAAFGVLQNQRILLLGFTVFILGLILAFYWKLPIERRYVPLRFLCVLVGAGAVGNMIDRLMQGYVVDFFYFKLIDFPIFNVADCYVVIAAIAAFFLVGFYYKDEDFAFLKR